MSKYEEVKNREIKRKIDMNLIEVTNTLYDVEILKARLMQLNARPLKNIYRNLKALKIPNVSNEVFLHTENSLRELDALESVLKDAEVILQQQAQYYGKTTIN